MSDGPPGFEEDDRLRSDFIRRLTLAQLERDYDSPGPADGVGAEPIPRTLVRYWNDPDDVPADVRRCLRSWEVLRDEGLSIEMFGDASARKYIAKRYGRREIAAFDRCRHPAMRSDYLRLCYVLAEGGLYVDADDVLVGEGWREVFRDHTLKVQPLCYDISIGGMVSAEQLRRPDLSTEGRIFYVNNNPIAAPAAHPVLRRALSRATDRLLGEDPAPEIQSTTGPGNLTASLAAHANERQNAGAQPDFSLLLTWDATAEPCWDLAYRADARNWRNMDAW
ncbi:glycosyltransferase family 32 protein [Georgenia faecalis]|uniref:Glycosyltransferase family 32 protein n=1 Tax=Georgenia faecalis TaxID=2483799 RepID=A0ABV9D9V8_9MICO|nr:glycosyltransferase [Georgenia faecalis]